jgi:hypothetical protein
MSESEVAELRKRLDALEARNAEFTAIINRGKGMLWLIAAVGLVVGFVLSTWAGIKALLT